MRIVYDDIKQNEAVELINTFVLNFKMFPQKILELVSYDYGMNRVKSYLFKDKLNKYLLSHNFEIGESVFHKNGIGNNNKHPIYFKGNSEEIQICGYININSGLYSEIYVSCEDYNGNRIGCNMYEINPNRVVVK